MKKNIYKYSLSRDKFYFSKPVFTLFNEKNTLVANVISNNEKQLYLSYETLNNSFSEAPVNSLLDLKNYRSYTFDIKIVSTENLKVLPYIIHYKNSKKVKLTKLSRGNQIIEFEEDDQCRLTFKILGHGSFEIKEISIMPKG